ncbi:bifunctional alpha/beta hydrolase/OsmC family protein [Sulfitobacter donghicola]|uniref:Osmotically inducible protein C n=1 Tax=Sulfitobacter donghicola DSW-25 = KCTC 12864 = JCM 14565 TaxID=1300350 RepID=A0A073IKV2_9RHOB|nr:bifunctional alpha/beta hydrolase/OsmC family protein [Sulfitobacter donghicola]KEJ90121.1 osmotically inducible protein C [Sulfitobacter donghicola DSW-25 = KCTC 12864 = JCM 14565]KIN66725.1 OsmC-like family protein [Sulfitobacter donghicola DSW-25 = KCTC 12864 = JCM 14565]
MVAQRITFPGHDGSQLSARLDLPTGPHVATAIFAHCFTCGKDIPAARRIAARLAAMGIAVLRFDFTGLGHSEGEFENTSFSSNVDDLIAAATWLAQEKMPPSLLIGHSLGGAAVIKAASMLDGIKAVATVGAPFDPTHVRHHFADALPEIAEKGSAKVSLGGRPFSIGKTFIQDTGAEVLTHVLGHLNAALLVMHAPLDQVVSVDSAAQIFMAAKHPKSFVSLDNADHLITKADDAEYVAEMIASWSTRYIDRPLPAPPIGTPEGIVRVSEADPAGFLQDITSGSNVHLLADEPLAYGGTNRGMSPYGFLSASLGACTSMTIRMYARRKEWPLENVRVDVSHDKVHAQDAATGAQDKIDNFVRSITLTGPELTAEQRERLLEIADRCPVHRTLERSSTVTTSFAD